MFKRTIYIAGLIVLLLAGVAIASEQTVVMEIKGMTCGI